MLSVDELDKSVVYANSFGLTKKNNNRVALRVPPEDRNLTFIWLDTVIFKSVYYPLLLSEIIEGINKKYRNRESKYCIDVNCEDINVFKRDFGCYPKIIDSFDLNEIDIKEAKEKAIRRVIGG